MAINNVGSNTPYVPPVIDDGSTPPPANTPPPAGKTTPAQQKVTSNDAQSRTDADADLQADDGTEDSTTVKTNTPKAADGVTPINPVGTSPKIIDVTVPPPTLSKAPALKTPVSNPTLTSNSTVSALSTGDLILLVQKLIKKTQEELSRVARQEITSTQKTTKAQNDATIAKLKDAISQQQKAAEEKKKLQIANWVLLAVATLISVVTFGAASPLTAIIVGAAIFETVPIKGKTGSEWLNYGIGKAIELAAKAAYKDRVAEDKYGKPYDLLSQGQKAELDKEFQEGGQYAATAAVIAAQIVIAVVVSVVTFGAGAPAAAGGAATAIAGEVAEDAVEIGVEVASEVAEEAVETAVEGATEAATEASSEAVEGATESASEVAENTAEVAEEGAEKGGEVGQKVADKSATITRNVKIAKGVIDGAQSLAKAGVDAGNIHASYLDWKATDLKTDAESIKAFVKYLNEILNQEEDFLKELIEAQAKETDSVSGILKTEHETNLHIASIPSNA
jgi:hypothetical protein